MHQKNQKRPYGYDIVIPQKSASESSGSESEDSEGVWVFDIPFEEVIKRGRELLKTGEYASDNSSEDTPPSYVPVFSEKTKEPSNQKEVNQFLVAQQAARQKLATEHQKQLQELLLNQNKEQKELETKQGKERQVFFDFGQPTTGVDSKLFSVNLSAST